MQSALLEEIRAMAPWHIDVELTDGVRTGEANRGTNNGEDYTTNLVDPAEMRPLLESLYPNGLAGKRFLDCACNAGGYSLLAHDLGATYCLGFDVRKHWIRQAEFLRGHFGKPKDEVVFEVRDLLDFDQRYRDAEFDVCLFKGIFYHLPDPINGLKLVADRTTDYLILDTAAAKDHEDGFLQLILEGKANPMSGVHHLAWRPTGPKVLETILNWLGFEATQLIWWRRPQRAKLARIRMVAARDASLLEGFSQRFAART